MPFRDALGDVLDALDRAHRSAAVFMYDECHCRSELEEKPRWRARDDRTKAQGRNVS
jgi:hypothetical protein